jgi:hypothetical protein
MVHFAEIDATNKVLRVIVCEHKEWCESRLGGTWVRTFYSTPGKNFAGQGFIYYPEAENFSAPQPYPSWILNTETYRWEAPVERPEGDYMWDEETTSWVQSPSHQN